MHVLHGSFECCREDFDEELRALVTSVIGEKFWVGAYGCPAICGIEGFLESLNKLLGCSDDLAAILLSLPPSLAQAIRDDPDRVSNPRQVPLFLDPMGKKNIERLI